MARVFNTFPLPPAGEPQTGQPDDFVLVWRDDAVIRVPLGTDGDRGIGLKTEDNFPVVGRLVSVKEINDDGSIKVSLRKQDLNASPLYVTDILPPDNKTHFVGLTGGIVRARLHEPRAASTQHFADNDPVFIDEGTANNVSFGTWNGGGCNNTGRAEFVAGTSRVLTVQGNFRGWTGSPSGGAASFSLQGSWGGLAGTDYLYMEDYATSGDNRPETWEDADGNDATSFIQSLQPGERLVLKITISDDTANPITKDIIVRSNAQTRNNNIPQRVIGFDYAEGNTPFPGNYFHRRGGKTRANDRYEISSVSSSSTTSSWCFNDTDKDGNNRSNLLDLFAVNDVITIRRRPYNNINTAVDYKIRIASVRALTAGVRIEYTQLNTTALPTETTNTSTYNNDEYEIIRELDKIIHNSVGWTRAGTTTNPIASGLTSYNGNYYLDTTLGLFTVNVNPATNTATLTPAQIEALLKDTTKSWRLRRIQNDTVTAEITGSLTLVADNYTTGTNGTWGIRIGTASEMQTAFGTSATDNNAAGVKFTLEDISDTPIFAFAKTGSKEVGRVIKVVDVNTGEYEVAFSNILDYRGGGGNELNFYNAVADLPTDAENGSVAWITSTNQFYKFLSGSWALQDTITGGSGGGLGWSPVLALVDDSVRGRKVWRVTGYEGGTGTTPTVSVGLYVGATGYVSNIANAVTASGARGLDGEDGDNGATWFTGNGLPASSLGNDNDLYLNEGLSDSDTTGLGDIYKKLSGTWTLQTNIKGADSVNLSLEAFSKEMGKAAGIGYVNNSTEGDNEHIRSVDVPPGIWHISAVLRAHRQTTIGSPDTQVRFTISYTKDGTTTQIGVFDAPVDGSTNLSTNLTLITEIANNATGNGTLTVSAAGVGAGADTYQLRNSTGQGTTIPVVFRFRTETTAANNNYKGVFALSTAYNTGDIVDYDGSAYLALQRVLATNTDNPTNGTVWRRLGGGTDGGGGITAVAHDDTLTGNGDDVDLSVANPFTQTDEDKLDGLKLVRAASDIAGGFTPSGSTRTAGETGDIVIDDTSTDGTTPIYKKTDTDWTEVADIQDLFRGTYSISQTYKQGQYVIHNTNWYVANVDILTGQVPGQNANWKLLTGGLPNNPPQNAVIRTAGPNAEYVAIDALPTWSHLRGLNSDSTRIDIPHGLHIRDGTGANVKIYMVLSSQRSGDTISGQPNMPPTPAGWVAAGFIKDLTDTSGGGTTYTAGGGLELTETAFSIAQPTVWSLGGTYEAGDRVEVGSDLYEAKNNIPQSNLNQSPTTDTTNWRRLTGGGSGGGTIGDRSITEPKLADDAVSTRTIADGAVVRNAIGDGEVVEAKIGDGEVSRAKLDTELTEHLLPDVPNPLFVGSWTVQATPGANTPPNNMQMFNDGDDYVFSPTDAQGDTIKREDWFQVGDPVTLTQGNNNSFGQVSRVDFTGTQIEFQYTPVGGTFGAQYIVLTQGTDVHIEKRLNAAGGTVPGVYANQDRFTEGGRTRAEEIDLRPNAITEPYIANNAITNAKMANNSVDTNEIVNGAIVDSKVSDVSASKITAGILPAARIGDDSITKAKMADNAVGASELDTVNAGTNGQVLEKDGERFRFVSKPEFNDDNSLHAVHSNNAPHIGNPATQATTINLTNGKSLTPYNLFNLNFHYTLPANIHGFTTNIGREFSMVILGDEFRGTSGQGFALQLTVHDNVAINIWRLSDTSFAYNFVGATGGISAITNFRLSGLTLGAVGTISNALQSVNTALPISGTGTTGNPATIADGAIAGAKLANGAVDTAKIADIAINANKISSNAVTKPKIANDAVDLTKIDTTSVGTDGQYLTKSGNRIAFVAAPSGGGNTRQWQESSSATTNLNDFRPTAVVGEWKEFRSASNRPPAATDTDGVCWAYTTETQTALGQTIATTVYQQYLDIGTNKIFVRKFSGSTWGTWVDTGGAGGGGAQLANDTEFAAGTITTKAPTVAQTVGAVDSVRPVLSFWDGETNPATDVNTGTTATVNAGSSVLQPYDATNKRLTLSQGNGAANQVGVSWSNALIDWNNFAMGFKLQRPTKSDGVVLMAFFGCDAANLPTLPQSQVSTQGFAFEISRANDTAHGLTPGGWLFGFVPYTGAQGSNNGRIAPTTFYNGAASGIASDGTNRNYVSLPGDPFYNVDEVSVILVRAGKLLKMYAKDASSPEPAIKYAEWRLTATQQNRTTGAAYGFRGGDNNAAAQLSYLKEIAVGNPGMTVVEEAFRVGEPQPDNTLNGITVPALPTGADGNYRLRLNKTGSTYTFSWVSDS